MSTTDPIAHMLTKMRNALKAKKREVEIPSSTLKVRMAEIFREEGYITDFRVLPDDKQGIIKVHLKYDENREGVISRLERVSKPSRRIYVNKDEVPFVLKGLGIAILSTSKGVMTDRAAREAGVGGEVLCYVW